MSYIVKPTNFFLEQIKDFDSKTKRILQNKLDLIKANPFRFKAIQTNYGRVFSVKFSIDRRAKRLIYLLKGSVAIICFVIDRGKDYKDLEKYFKKIEEELR